MHLTDIYRHPVKSLGAERLEAATLEAGKPLAWDRAFAITHGESAFDPAAPAWVACKNFLRITHIPTLAALDVSFDPETQIFSATRDWPQDEEVITIEADLSTEAGRAELAAWVAPMVGDIRLPPFNVVSVKDEALTDVRGPLISIKSRMSLLSLEKKMKASLHLRRFRGNLWIDACDPRPSLEEQIAATPSDERWPRHYVTTEKSAAPDKFRPGFTERETTDLEPWAENDWIGRELKIGGARLRVVERIGRCIATAADPENGERNFNPFATLRQHYQEANFGVLAEIVETGEVRVGDSVALLDEV